MNAPRLMAQRPGAAVALLALRVTAFAAQFGRLSFFFTAFAAVLAPLAAFRDRAATGWMRAFPGGVGHRNLLVRNFTPDRGCRRGNRRRRPFGEQGVRSGVRAQPKRRLGD